MSPKVICIVAKCVSIAIVAVIAQQKLAEKKSTPSQKKLS